MQSGPRVIVGVSGGVDSAVCAHLLIRAGHQVEGLFMQNWSEDADAYCSAAEDYESAAAVCRHLDIVLHRADFSREYRTRVFSHFLTEYAAGRTPNPDLLCNREIKFGEFRRHALRLGADAIATGHYARLSSNPQHPDLLLAADENKDQTYFLAAVHGADLRNVLFPLGDLRKSEVREIANRIGLPNFQRRDSTGICFVGERPMREFLSRYMDDQPGPIVTRDGQTLGMHPGLAYFTLGQRRGLGIGGQRNAAQAPWYVIEKRSEQNALVVSQQHNDAALLSRSIRCRDAHWLGAPPSEHDALLARIRHRQTPSPCRYVHGADGFELQFEKEQWAATPGQYAVIYRDEHCLGCGVIDECA